MSTVRRTSLSRLGVLTALAMAWPVVPVQAQDVTPNPLPDASPLRTTTPAATPTPQPGAAEVALCEDEAAALLTPGANGPMIASLAGADAPTRDGRLMEQPDGPRSGSAGCQAPTSPFQDPFGAGSLDLFTIGDAGGDGPLDILRTRWGEVELTRAQARSLDRDERIVVVGKRAKVLKAGRFQAVCVELATEPVVGDTIHIGTDTKGDPFRRIPSSVAGPAGELANIRDVATLYVEKGGPRLFSSDLSTGEWYTGKGRFGALLDGRDACFLFPTNQLGTDFRPVTFRPGDAGGYDTGGLGSAPGLLATSGTFGWIDDCIEQMLIHEPLVLEGVEVSYSTDWVTFCFGASDSDLDEVDDFLDDVGDQDGVARGLIRFKLQEEGQENEQERPLAVWIEDDRIYFSFPVGLKAYGFHALRDVAILSTGDDVLDDILDEAAQAIGRRVNPTTFDAAAGRMQGDRECKLVPGQVG
jgi:hypothetical protein